MLELQVKLEIKDTILIVVFCYDDLILICFRDGKRANPPRLAAGQVLSGARRANPPQ